MRNGETDRPVVSVRAKDGRTLVGREKRKLKLWVALLLLVALLVSACEGMETPPTSSEGDDGFGC